VLRCTSPTARLDLRGATSEAPPFLSTDLSDEEWAILQPLVPEAKLGGRPRAHETREPLDAIFYVVRGGCAWRLLPHDFPPWQTAYHYFRLWRLDGSWEKIHATLRERTPLREGRQEAPSAAVVDSQSVRTTEKGGSAAMTEPRR
jgi:transposase